ncbi:hypothetical protein [Paenibacillus oryzisoli]|uniref:Uncharacterized protein n=1 Tax=Paenibacillus oryzisoli TaxID=1850517 RepID=A0A198A6G4_9BACL|nr:hypothetical protein [Paenibacillus oryzisoli]OAS17064.1 hypothetical protein A8708_02255 [Paenibacillus oryzisoli]
MLAIACEKQMMAVNMLAGRFNSIGTFIRTCPNYGEEDYTGWAIIDELKDNEIENQVGITSTWLFYVSVQ